MKYRKTLTCGSKPDRPFKYIFIDYPFGHSIRLHGVEVGGFLVRDETWKGNIKVSLLEGIEIEPEFRGRGIGRAVVKQLMERCDMVIGSITEDDCKPFWNKLGAVTFPIPLEYFNEKLRPSIHTEEPLFFYLTKNKKAAELGEIAGKQIPELIKKI